MPRITDNTIIRKRIDEVRNIMKKNSTDLYIVFTGTICQNMRVITLEKENSCQGLQALQELLS